MSQAETVARLAVRELWMSFRLLITLAAYVVAGMSVALLPPAPLAVAADRLALALGVAAAVAAALAAWTVGVERIRGRTAWLVTRSVPRGTVLNGWFAALAGTALVGHVVAAGVGWVLALGVAADPDAGGYLVLVVATMAGTLALVGIGIVAGLLLEPAAALIGTTTIAGTLGLVAVTGILPPPIVPGAGAFAILAGYGGASAVVAPGLLAAGTSLAAVAALLAAGRLLVERADL